MMERKRTKAFFWPGLPRGQFLPPGSLFSTAEARPSNSPSPPKPGGDPPPSKTAGGAVQQAEGLRVLAMNSHFRASEKGWTTRKRGHLGSCLGKRD